MTGLTTFPTQYDDTPTDPMKQARKPRRCAILKLQPTYFATRVDTKDTSEFKKRKKKLWPRFQ